MLTNKVFDTFLAVLQQQANRPPVSSLAEGQLWQQDLQRARLEFEDALSSKLLDLSKEKQIEFLTQVLTLFKANSALLLSQPAYLWHINKWIDEGLKWQREPNEPSAVKTFRDECERLIVTNIDGFLDHLEASRETAKEASHFVRLVTDHVPGTIDGVPEMELDYEEGRWIEEGLRILEAGKAQENVRQYFEKLAGKETAAYWILNPDSWYDVHREALGLPWLQEKFQASYEAWHFYYDRPTSEPQYLVFAAVPDDIQPPNYTTIGTTEKLPIDNVLSIPRSKLDQLLIDAAMIEPDAMPGRYKAKATVRPWQWANVRAALLERLLLAELNDEDAAALFRETYGAIVSRGTMQQRPNNEIGRKNKPRRVSAYSDFLERLPFLKR